MRLVDAEKLTAYKYSGVDFLKFANTGWHKSDKEIYAFKCGWNEALSTVSNAVSTVDAVPVVRCKDCKYYEEYMEGKYRCWEMILDPAEPTDFCSFAERRKDVKND